MSDEITQRDLEDLVHRERVVALMDRYLATLDEPGSLDVDWARCLFSEDVRIEHRGVLLEGPEQVAAGHDFVKGGWAQTFHFSTNHQVVVDGRHAHLSARLMAIHVHRGPNPPDPYFIANRFEADAVHTPDGWRFSGLQLQNKWSSGQSHLDIGRDRS